jgi:hypothetical protein
MAEDFSVTVNSYLWKLLKNVFHAFSVAPYKWQWRNTNTVLKNNYILNIIKIARTLRIHSLNSSNTISF